MRLTTVITGLSFAGMLAAPVVVDGCYARRCDEVKRERIFFGCLEKLPKGPDHLTAAGNDWDETIFACRVTADSFACDEGWSWK